MSKFPVKWYGNINYSSVLSAGLHYMYSRYTGNTDPNYSKTFQRSHCADFQCLHPYQFILCGHQFVPNSGRSKNIYKILSKLNAFAL